MVCLRIKCCYGSKVTLFGFDRPPRILHDQRSEQMATSAAHNGILPVQMFEQKLMKLQRFFQTTSSHTVKEQQGQALNFRVVSYTKNSSQLNGKAD